MKAAGIENGNQLARYARLTSPVAYRLLSGEPFERVDVAVLDALCEAFSCQPGDLLAHTPEKKRR
jgi:DNA-binding Xre family transcriptional regulator